ncbi:MAG TPA: adenylate/guanylate cyclase domain-containing protein [Thermohalobaculum sp.]|nr:adenylate/guanylate cyclase domain-containing protein [Thermohalobaculum sp.]
MERRLAAILVADIAGYSAAVGRDEAGAIDAYKGHFSALEPIIGLHGGRVVKTMGDGFLAEFASVVDAVSCASVMQERVAERNSDQPDDVRLVFRMGVHVGDVIVDGDDILGDGVNIAARLQEFSEPGGVAVSGRVHEDVADRLDLEFTDKGPQAFKNIARPVRTFALIANRRASRRAPAPERPDKPSVAVLPFANMSPDAEQEYFADGIAEDIITSLSYVPWLFVIARNSTFSYKGLAVDVREIGQQLGVRYVLEGSVRRAGERLRVTGQLVDAETGAHLWADRYDGGVEDIFDLQDRITEAVVGAIAPEIRSAEIARSGRKRPDSLDAYDHYLRALAALNRARIDEAETHLDSAIARAPTYAKVRAMRAWCTTLGPWVSRPLNVDEVEAAGADAEEVLDRLETDVEDEAYAGYVLAFSGRDPARGLRLVEKATERCPSFAWAWTSSAMLRAYRGEGEIGATHGLRALRLSPNDPMAFRSHMALCFAYTASGNHEATLEYAKKGLELNPRATVFLRFQAVALAHLGRMDESRRALRRHMQAAPGFRVSNYISSANYLGNLLGDGIKNTIVEGLRLAGMPE